MHISNYRTVGKIILKGENRNIEHNIIPTSNVEKVMVPCWSHQVTDTGWW